MKQGHMIIENIAILDQSLGPAPDHVKMLWLVAIETLMKQI
jgi:hypothetical protein